MSDYLFGERYFAKRDRLAQVTHGIANFARETSTDLSNLLPNDSEESSRFSPFQFVVCGDTNCGKSTLINTLVNHDLCPVSDLPLNEPICHYRYDATSRDHPVSPELENRYRPAPFLKNFNLIDCPGTGILNQEHLDALASIYSSADLILCVFPISNPWGASTWNHLTTLPLNVLQRVVIVVQQIDQRDSTDARVTMDHIADLASKRLDLIPPIFAASAQLAAEAKKSTPPNHSLLHSSGFDTLESFISQHIDSLDNRRSWLQSSLQRSAKALSLVEDQIEDQTRNIRDQSRFMEQVESEIVSIRETFIRRLPVHLVNVAEAFESEAIGVTKQLNRKLGAIRSIIRLFTGDQTGTLMESTFISRIQTAIENVSQKDSKEVVESCKDHWEELETRVKENMGIELTSTRPIEDILTEAQTRFSNRLQRAAHEGIHNLKVRNQLDKELRRRNIALKSFTCMVLFFTSAAATCGALKIPWAPIILLGAAALFLIGDFMTAWMTRRTITREFKTRLLDTCGAFAHTLHADYEEALRIVFQDYKETLADVRDHLGRDKLAIEPRLRRWQGLFLTLKTIEQEL